MSPDPAALEELVRRIKESVQPLRIILFGSAARGEMGPDSDVDVLVVVPDGGDCLRIAQSLHMELRGFAYPKDIVVVQQGDLERYGDNPSLVLYPALREGKELYRAAS